MSPFSVPVIFVSEQRQQPEDPEEDPVIGHAVVMGTDHGPRMLPRAGRSSGNDSMTDEGAGRFHGPWWHTLWNREPDGQMSDLGARLGEHARHGRSLLNHSSPACIGERFARSRLCRRPPRRGSVGFPILQPDFSFLLWEQAGSSNRAAMSFCFMETPKRGFGSFQADFMPTSISLTGRRILLELACRICDKPNALADRQHQRFRADQRAFSNLPSTTDHHNAEVSDKGP